MSTLRPAIVTLFATLSALAASTAIAQDMNDTTRQQRMDAAYQDFKSGQSSGTSSSNMSTSHHMMHGTGSAARAEESIKRGAHKTGQAIKHGAEKTGEAVEHGVEKTKEAAHEAHQKMKGASEPS
ncbi:MAG: hypothetical protein JSR59_17340 [Proteobacteria bacterium]|nr:hypothetical protein [Pseudomonadota bacterium]